MLHVLFINYSPGVIDAVQVSLVLQEPERISITIQMIRKIKVNKQTKRNEPKYLLEKKHARH